MTFKDFKVKAKKILVILNLPFLPRITVGTYKYEGYVIYEDLYGATDFYCQISESGVIAKGSFEVLTDSLDHIECQNT